MSFAALAADMNAVILSQDGVAEPAMLTVQDGVTPVPTFAVIDEPSETAHGGIALPVIRERKTTLTLPLPSATGIKRGSTVRVDEGGTGARIRTFRVDGEVERDPDQIRVTVLELPS